jgi:hypothetical protein
LKAVAVNFYRLERATMKNTKRRKGGMAIEEELRI